MKDQAIIKIANDLFGAENVKCIAYTKLYQGPPGVQYKEVTKLEGIFVVVQQKQVNEVSVDRIRELMGEVLLRPVEEISARDDFIHDLEADSLQAVSLLAALENEYDVSGKTVGESVFSGRRKHHHFVSDEYNGTG